MFEKQYTLMDLYYVFYYGKWNIPMEDLVNSFIFEEDRVRCRKVLTDFVTIPKEEPEYDNH